MYIRRFGLLDCSLICVDIWEGKLSEVGRTEGGTCLHMSSRNILSSPHLSTCVRLSSLKWGTSITFTEVCFLLDVDNEIYSKMVSSRNDLSELLWNCTECSYTSKKKTNTFRHIEATHMSCSYSCPVCGHDARSRFNLKQHISLKHRSAPAMTMS